MNNYQINNLKYIKKKCINLTDRSQINKKRKINYSTNGNKIQNNIINECRELNNLDIIINNIKDRIKYSNIDINKGVNVINKCKSLVNIYNNKFYTLSHLKNYLSDINQNETASKKFENILASSNNYNESINYGLQKS